MHIINIQNPTNPTYTACFDNDGYTHDAQCVIYNGPDMDYNGKEICFNSNENSITIVNVEDKDNIQMISRSEYQSSQYAHQGWLTEDHKYFLSNDELDEYNNGTNTKTLIWDVRDLEDPVLIGSYEHSTTSIDHNLYIVGNKVYESNYTSGLRILDISDIENANLEEIAFFDTYPSDDNPSFRGTWSNYPFFNSGVIATTDITNGLFLLKPHYEAFIITHPKNTMACIGDNIVLPIEVKGDNITYAWQINSGTGFEDITDIVAYNNTNTKSLHINEVSFEQNQYQFRCKITTANETYFTNSAVLEITDNPIANFEFSISQNIVTFGNTSYAASTYEWDFGDDSSINMEEAPQHTYNFESFEYSVTLSAFNECSSNSLTKDVNIVVLSLESSSKENFFLYPIPASGIIKFESNLKNPNAKFSIYTSAGKQVLKGIMTIDGNTINVNVLPKGIYFIKIQLSVCSEIKGTE